MKTIAMYLPQFHEIPENDEWWGKGYTEWTAVKTAEPLIENHYQPRVPLNDYYYNLLEKTTMQWQATLMHQYGVYGLCFYHYYFDNGKKVLEKPAENLLSWHDIDMPFCFSWANETWARTWSKVAGSNFWNKKLENKSTSDDGVLLKQEYGDEKQWREHFEYLLPFFMDERYIRIDNKPLFLIHKPDHISCIYEMIDCWQSLAQKHDMKGLYVMGVNSNKECFDAVLQQESNYSDLFIPYKNKEYNELTEQIIVNAYLSDSDHFLCATPGYDDSPRRGREGEIVFNSTPETFYEQLRALIYFAEKRKQDVVFINAWNEWGEGMYLEPDMRFKYGYLESVKAALEKNFFSDEEIGHIMEKVNGGLCKLAQFQKEKINIIATNNELLEQLCLARERGDSLSEKLYKNGISSVGVFGLGKIGKHIVFELQHDNFDISFGIDRAVCGDNFEFPVWNSMTDIPETGAIILTFKDEALLLKLKRMSKCPVLSIPELLGLMKK